MKKNTCFYCGEAPVNHQLFRLDNFISSVLESHMLKVNRYVPHFLKDFIDLIPIFLFNTLAFFKLAEFSSDIDKANTFRSKIIWEEAKKRGILMEQVIFFRKPLDQYRAKINGRTIYFESIPIRPEFLDFKSDWDNKITLKEELKKHHIPVPEYLKLSPFRMGGLEQIFSKIKTPVIIKPQIGSRARHTVTNINNFDQFKAGIEVTNQISFHLVVEEYLKGTICRATVVGGCVAGFYQGSVPSVTGDGEKKIKELIVEKNSKTIDRYHVRFGQELYDHVLRQGFDMESILPKGISIPLSHRAGQLFGGMTREMIDELHPSFVPILEKAARVTGLSVAGFDCIIPDPTKDEASQRWGIIECNTLPFIDMHYYALEGKPRNIAGMIWDMWER